MSNYNAVSREQADANRMFAIANAGLNRVDTYGPGGEVTWSLRPGANPNDPRLGDYVQTTRLSPSGQAQFDARNAIQEAMLNTARARMGEISDTFSRPMDTSGLRGWGNPISTMNNPNAGQYQAFSMPPRGSSPGGSRSSPYAPPVIGGYPPGQSYGGGGGGGRAPNAPSYYTAPPPLGVSPVSPASPQLLSPGAIPGMPGVYDAGGGMGMGSLGISGPAPGASGSVPGGGINSGLPANSVSPGLVNSGIGLLGTFFGLPMMGQLANLTGVGRGMAHSMNSALNRGAVAATAPPGTPAAALAAMIDSTPLAGEAMLGGATATTGPNGTGGQAAQAGAAAAAAAAANGFGASAQGAAAQAAANATLAGATPGEAAMAGAAAAAAEGGMNGPGGLSGHGSLGNNDPGDVAGPGGFGGDVGGFNGGDFGGFGGVY